MQRSCEFGFHLHISLGWPEQGLEHLGQLVLSSGSVTQNHQRQGYSSVSGGQQEFRGDDHSSGRKGDVWSMLAWNCCMQIPVLASRSPNYLVDNSQRRGAFLPRSYSFIQSDHQSGDGRQLTYSVRCLRISTRLSKSDL